MLSRFCKKQRHQNKGRGSHGEGERSRPRQQGPDMSELCLPTFNSPGPTDSLTGVKTERVDLNGRGSFQQTNLLNIMAEAGAVVRSTSRGLETLLVALFLTSSPGDRAQRGERQCKALAHWSRAKDDSSRVSRCFHGPFTPPPLEMGVPVNPIPVFSLSH